MLRYARAVGDLLRTEARTEKNLDLMTLELGKHVPSLAGPGRHSVHQTRPLFFGGAEFPEDRVAEFPELLAHPTWSPRTQKRQWMDLSGIAPPEFPELPRPP